MDGPWEIRDGAVGSIELGRPLPSELLQDAERRYFARYVADGVPFEGFEFDDPPLLVGLRGGPLEGWVRAHGVAEPPVDELRNRAVRRARDGALVRAIVVGSARVRTSGGIGVGSTLAEIEAALGEAKAYPVPPTFGDDLCNVRVGTLPGVSFVFATCDAAREGAAVQRVDLWEAED